MIYRRFGVLHSRLLLCKQDEIRRLESQLEDMDHRDDIREGRKGKIWLACWDRDSSRKAPTIEEERARGNMMPAGYFTSRKELLVEIERKLLEYGMSAVSSCARFLASWRVEADKRADGRVDGVQWLQLIIVVYF